MPDVNRKSLTQRLREQDWPEAAERIDALEAALRYARVWLKEIELATVDEPVGILGNKAAAARNIIDRALAAPDA